MHLFPASNEMLIETFNFDPLFLGTAPSLFLELSWDIPTFCSPHPFASPNHTRCKHMVLEEAMESLPPALSLSHFESLELLY